MKKIIVPFITAILISVTSCYTVPVIPQDLTYTQLIQLGQDSIEIANYKAAEAYYSAVIQRYGMNTNIYIEATYELGHLYLRQKKYEEAFPKFNEILGLYEEAEAGILPASYKKLAQIGLNQIPDKYKPSYN